MLSVLQETLDLTQWLQYFRLFELLTGLYRVDFRSYVPQINQPEQGEKYNRFK